MAECRKMHGTIFCIKKGNSCISQLCATDTSELEKKFEDPEFLVQLAIIEFLPYLNYNHLNFLSLNLQEKTKPYHLSDLVGINGSLNKLTVFKHTLVIKNLIQFPSCLQLTEGFKDNYISSCSFQIKEVIDEFIRRFEETEYLNSSLLLYNNLLGG